MEDQGVLSGRGEVDDTGSRNRSLRGVRCRPSRGGSDRSSPSVRSSRRCRAGGRARVGGRGDLEDPAGGGPSSEGRPGRREGSGGRGSASSRGGSRPSPSESFTSGPRRSATSYSCTGSTGTTPSPCSRRGCRGTTAAGGGGSFTVLEGLVHGGPRLGRWNRGIRTRRVEGQSFLSPGGRR